MFLLNRYFAIVGEAVEKAGGRLDKFIGDGAMALFGLEAAPGEASRQALAAARAIVDGTARLSDELAGEISSPVHVAIGIHIGPAIVGSMGFGSTMGVTAIGDTVNISSRLEAAAKEFNADLVISEAAAKLSGLDFSAAEQREIDIRGRARPLGVYRGRARHADTRAADAASGGPAQAEPPRARNSSGRADRIERHLVEFVVAAIHQPDRHLLALPVDVDQAEELQPRRGRQVLALLGGRRLHEFELGAERHVEIAGPEGAGMDRPRHELPERREILELRLVRDCSSARPCSARRRSARPCCRSRHS